MLDVIKFFLFNLLTSPLIWKVCWISRKTQYYVAEKGYYVANYGIFLDEISRRVLTVIDSQQY